MKKEADNRLALLDVLVDNTLSSPTTCIYHKTTYTGLLTNFFSFTSHSYKIGLVRTVVGRTYKINNTCQGLHKDIETRIIIVKKLLFPCKINEQVIKQYLNNTSLSSTPLATFNTESSTESTATSNLSHFVLLFLLYVICCLFVCSYFNCLISTGNSHCCCITVLVLCTRHPLVLYYSPHSKHPAHSILLFALKPLGSSHLSLYLLNDVICFIRS